MFIEDLELREEREFLNFMLHDSPNQTRLLAKLIWDLLRQQKFESLSDLTSALKDRCAKLKLKVTAEAINGAFTLIASNTPLVDPPKRVATSEREPADAREIGQADAAAILRSLGVSVRGGRIAPVADLASDPPIDDEPEDFPRLVVVS